MGLGDFIQGVVITVDRDELWLWSVAYILESTSG
jgi:hypothetical protein